MKFWRSPAFYLYIVDHGFLRLLYANFHALPGGLFRANQPNPAKLERYRRELGIKTVINLRGGDQSNPAWQIEKSTCDALGLKMLNLQLFSRSFPHVHTIKKIKATIDLIDYPALVHCKSGADRAGLFAVLYRMFRLKEPISEARKELSLRFGHIRWARTGVVDLFFDEYEKAYATSGIGFEEWLETGYDREGLKAAYPDQKLLHRIGNFLLDRLIRRE